LLLNSIGPASYQKIAALSAPVALTTLKYVELVKLLEKHLAPKKNVLVAQHQFLSKYQEDDQSISEYLTSLRAGVAECDFVVTSVCPCPVSVADLFLRAQFIRGIKDSSVREKLIQSCGRSFQEMVAEATACEASKVDARRISK